VITSVSSPPGCVVKLVEAGVREKSGGVVLNVAVTKLSWFIVTLHSSGAVQAPVNAEKDPEAAEAVTVIRVPVAKVTEQDVPQSMPAGLLVTVPLPLPSSNTESVCTVGASVSSITVVVLLPMFAT